MKIALVVHDLHEQGGHSLYTRVLADELSVRHEVTVFANRCERPVASGWSFQPVSALRMNALATVRTFPLGLGTLAAKFAGFDIRHMQGYCGGQPNVVTAHICVAAYLNSLQSITTRNRASLKLMAAAEARFYRRYEGAVIAISQKIAGELREFYQVRGPITVIPHGVDLSRFADQRRGNDRALVRSEVGISEDSTVALYVGDLTKAHVHLKALASAAPNVSFVIITPSRRYRWQSANVHFIEPTSSIERYYRAADALVFPTTYDAFGMVALEAMASGLPVFTSDCAGAAELMHSGKDGFVIPLDRWVEATAAGLHDRDCLVAVGQEAATTAKKHSWSGVVHKVEQVYLTTAGSESAGVAQEVPNGAYRYQQ